MAFSERKWEDLHNPERNDVVGALFITPDGRILKSSLDNFPDLEQIARHCAEMMELATSVSFNAQRGTDDQFYIKTEQGVIVGMSVDLDQILVIVTREHAKLGLLMLDIGRNDPQKGHRLVEPVFPRKPPGRLSAGAKPDEDA